MNSEQIGIWIDSREAFVISPEGDITRIKSNVEEGNPHGATALLISFWLRMPLQTIKCNAEKINN